MKLFNIQPRGGIGLFCRLMRATAAAHLHDDLSQRQNTHYAI